MISVPILVGLTSIVGMSSPAQVHRSFIFACLFTRLNKSVPLCRIGQPSAVCSTNIMCLGDIQCVYISGLPEIKTNSSQQYYDDV